MSEPILLLVVDDQKANRDARTRVLEEGGYCTQEAPTGLEALAKIRELHPAMVLLDVDLPDISSLEICRKIRNAPETADTVILQISASAVSPSQRAAGLTNGADGYLMEPVDAEVLLATVNALLRMRTAERRLHQLNESLHQSNEALSRANEALLRSNDDLMRFSYSASHDLQEPLRTIHCFTDLLKRDYQGQLDDRAAQYLYHIQSGVERMGNLIRGLLSFASVAHSESNDCIIDLKVVLQAALENLGLAIAETKAEITCEELPLVIGNEVLLTQLFQNLLSNAIKYRGAERPLKIHIGVECTRGNFVCCLITDNGIGVEPQFHNRIFAPFSRLQESDAGGSGIGLTTCRRIVERLGGAIWLESAGRDQGCTFYFTLRTSDGNHGQDTI
ncbi:sensor histidine kinase [Bryobacter aggregatus]|uniref:sensor histidine kinase n=1 Tax=Bryobacter aggregatus TaxID=360054 RepID=UPI00068FAFC3|nr:ATP-binding protein [Bryobacter aggregatus]